MKAVLQFHIVLLYFSHFFAIRYIHYHPILAPNYFLLSITHIKTGSETLHYILRHGTSKNPSIQT